MKAGKIEILKLLGLLGCIFVLPAVFFLFSACNDAGTPVEGSSATQAERCLEGVIYYQFRGEHLFTPTYAPKFLKTGKVALCPQHP